MSHAWDTLWGLVNQGLTGADSPDVYHLGSAAMHVSGPGTNLLPSCEPLLLLSLSKYPNPTRAKGGAVGQEYLDKDEPLWAGEPGPPGQIRRKGWARRGRRELNLSRASVTARQMQSSEISATGV